MLLIKCPRPHQDLRFFILSGNCSNAMCDHDTKI